MNTEVSRHLLKARRVAFDFTQSPLHWIPGDPFSSHTVNGINILLPEGELWFCRVMNQALPFVTDPDLKADVEGFIRQEAIHARAHMSGQAFLRSHGINLDQPLGTVTWLFKRLLGDVPLGWSWLDVAVLRKPWLLIRCGVIAAIEHFTGVLGQWSLDSRGWDEADPVITDLFRWHLAEEVEHRTVAYELFRTLSPNALVFYLLRCVLMLIVYPLFIYFVASIGRDLARQDPHPDSQVLGRRSLLRLLVNFEQIGRKTDHVPTLTLITQATLRWFVPGFDPIHEGNTQQALDYMARSPAVQRLNQ